MADRKESAVSVRVHLGAARESTLPVGTSIADGPTYVPRCDVCGWSGLGCWERHTAVSAVKRHAHGREHIENATEGAAMTEPNEQRARAVAARLQGAIPKVGQRDHWYLMLGVDNGDALASELERLREALRPFAGAEHKVWKGTGYGDACRAASRALDQETR